MANIAIDRPKFKASLHSTERPGENVQITLSIPPDFVPYFVKGNYVEQHDCFQIEFNYLDKEEEKLLHEDDKIEIIVGKNTQKLMKLRILGIKRNKINRVALVQAIQTEVPRKIKGQEANLPFPAQWNYRGIQEVLRNEAEDLSVAVP